MEYSLKQLLFLFLPSYLFSLGGAPKVISGSADYTATGSAEVITVSDKTILEYQKFHIDQHEMTRYEQPSAKSVLLCRIKGQDPSVIRGRLEANGKLLLINPQGILFSETAHVSVGTLIASTLDIRNDDFLRGRYRFKVPAGAQESTIVNEGHIEAANHVVLMAERITNRGVIAAKQGTVLFMGGEVMTLDFDGDDKIRFAIETPVKKGVIEQAGSVTAGHVHMTLSTAHKAVSSVLNDTGLVEAGRIETEEGVIRLVKGGKTEATVGEITCAAKTVEQGAPVVAAGPVHYTADRILLGDDITTNSAITLNGPVMLFNKDRITLTAHRYGKGDITLTSTVDADRPTRALTLNNPRSVARIGGAIGKQGLLGGLAVSSEKVILGDSAEIDGRLQITANQVECQGALYRAGEQGWTTGKIRLTQEGPVEFKTAGGPLNFASRAKLAPESSTSLTFTTQGGRLDLAPIESDHPQPVTISTGKGDAHLQEIGPHVTALRVEGENIFLSGQLEAGQIFMEAGHSIGYAKGDTVIPTALKSKGAVTLNAKQGTVGSADRPVWVKAQGKLRVGAKTTAYVRGVCLDQYAYPYEANPPPSIMFNNYEYKAFFFDDQLGDDDLLKTLAPSLARSGSTVFMEGGALSPRKASMYYEIQ
jgi:filamentous hemagglutinin family protein